MKIKKATCFIFPNGQIKKARGKSRKIIRDVETVDNNKGFVTYQGLTYIVELQKVEGEDDIWCQKVIV